MRLNLEKPLARSIVFICATTALSANAADICPNKESRNDIHHTLSELLSHAAEKGDTDLWGTIVNHEGVVCAISHPEDTQSSAQPNSRLISAQKANTANIFSLPSFALSTANLHNATKTGGTLFGLYKNPTTHGTDNHISLQYEYGTINDPMIGDKIDGLNVLGGGLALYNSAGILVGALGISGDSPCTNHNIAWKIRHELSLDFVPAGPSANHNDQIIYTGEGATGFEHPECEHDEKSIIAYLPDTQSIIN